MFKKYKRGLTRHLDDWIKIVENEKMPIGSDAIKNVELVKRVLAHPDIRDDPERIEECIELIEK